MADKVHKSLRIDRPTAEAVTRLREDGESEAAAYCRVIAAGVASLEGGCEAGRGSETDAAGADAGTAAALEAHIESLKEEAGRMAAQLEAKDRQIEALSVIAAQAQATASKAITDGKGRGWLSRHFGRNRMGSDERGE